MLFCDLAGSTSLGEQLDAESLRRVMQRYYGETRAVLERHGGTVEKFIGDAVMSVFGIPRLHEDDALRAVRAAAELREVLAALNEELEPSFGLRLDVRIGLNTGEVVTEEGAPGDSLATGDAVNIAARLEQVAGQGEILIGDATQRLVRDAVVVEPVAPLTLRGKSEAVPAWRLVEVLADAAPVARRLDSPLVGRTRELALLEQAFRRAMDESACHMFTLLGPAGVGKSRLVAELASSIDGEATLLVGRCLPYGDGITLWPIVDVVGQAAGTHRGLTPEQERAKLAALFADEEDASAVAERVAEAIGLADESVPAEESFWALRRLFEAVARTHPLVLVFDDLHWGEPMFLDLVEYLADWIREVPLLIVCLARPELLEERPTWGGGKMNATSILLEPLSEADSELLIQNLLGDAGLGENVSGRVAAAAEGNPLFVEEMLAMLIDDGVLERENGSWRVAGDLAGISVPPTIHALLAARLDGLPSEERAVIGHASVGGKVVARDAIVELAPEFARSALERHLSALVRKDLIRPTPTEFGPSFRFRHILIRDAAYQSIPKETRADLHERFAAWVEGAVGGRVREYGEILGYHLEQAARLRAELAPDDEHARELAGRAAGLLVSAGKRAFGRGDMPAAATLLARASDLLPDDDRRRLELAPELGGALIDMGQLASAKEVLSRAIAVAEAAGDRRSEWYARVGYAGAQLRIDPEGATEEVSSTVDQAITVFNELGDELGLARAWLRLSDVHWMASRWGARADALERASEHARLAGAAREQALATGALALCFYWGPTPVGEAIRRCEEELPRASSDQVLEARLLVVLAGLHAMRGSFGEARELYARSKGLLEELGQQLQMAVHTLVRGVAELLADDPVAAEQELRWGCNTLEQMSERAGLPTLRAVLAEALLQQGRLGEAEELVELSEHGSAPRDIAAQVQWRGMRAKLLARRGDGERAEPLALEAVALAEKTDALNLHAEALGSLAEVLATSGERTRAEAALLESADLYAAKENAVSEARTRAMLESLQAAPAERSSPALDRDASPE